MKPTPVCCAVLAFAASSGALAQTPAPGAPNTTVQDVVVSGQRPVSQTLIDRKVYTVSHDLQAASGTAADVLQNLPSVAVDADGNVSLRGDPNVTILIDGKPSAEFSGPAAGPSLLTFPASQIDRIEVLTNPPAQYKASGSGGVINIITRKTIRPGLSGAVRASGGDQGRFVLGLDAAWSNKLVKLSGGVGLRRDLRERVTSTDRVADDPVSGAPVQSAEVIDEHFDRLTPSVKARVEVDPDDRRTLTASFSDRTLIGDRFFDQTDASGPPGGDPTALSTRHSDGHEWHMDASGGLEFEQKLSRPGETLTLGLNRSVTREHEHYNYTNTYPLPVAPDSFDDLHLGMDLVKSEASADYDLPLSKDGDLKLGYDFEDDRNDFDNRGDLIDPVSGLPTVNPNVTNDFRYRQHVHAAYGQFQGAFEGFDVQAGLRLEAAQASWLLITGNTPGSNSDFGLYPSLHLDRSFGERSKLSLAVGRRIDRPDPEALNPFADHQDTHNLRAGNPDLKPQDTWNLQVGWASGIGPVTYSATAYYRIDQNAVTDVLTPVAADVVLATKANLPLSRSFGLEFGADGKLGARLSYHLSGNAFSTQIDAAQLGFPGLRTTRGVDLKASLDYRPTAKDTFQVSVSRTDSRLTPQGYLSAINLVNLGWRRQLTPKLSLVATVSDLFDGQRFIRVTNSPDLTQTYERHQLGRIVLAGFVYSFGGSPKKASGFEYDP
jgi:outer membrane receptor protein involved in Fe transport